MPNVPLPEVRPPEMLSTHVGVLFLPFPLLFTPLRKESQFFLKLEDSQCIDMGRGAAGSGGRGKSKGGDREHGGDREDTQALDARVCTTPVPPGEEVEYLKAELAASCAREKALRSELAACQARLGESEAEVMSLKFDVASMLNPEPELYSHWNPDCVCQDQEVRHEEALERMEEEHNQALARVEGEHSQALARVEGEHSQALARVEGEHSQALRRMKAQHRLDVGASVRTWNLLKENSPSSISALNCPFFSPP